ncbi:TetR/AcrR family transcriptional regulator [Paenibacillus sp. NPDC058071]|uniref:TetR/AcrR family transcriptional regulator n=1 Tax=Paenibacillus sp. NPDC058071 TaxID=3346326 RepID=UPI0036DCFEA4
MEQPTIRRGCRYSNINEKLSSWAEQANEEVNEVGTKVRNLRMTRTKQSLIDAFIKLINEKDFDKITIADLTEGAQVNRATFYAHFNDKYDYWTIS